MNDSKKDCLSDDMVQALAMNVNNALGGLIQLCSFGTDCAILAERSVIVGGVELGGLLELLPIPPVR